MSEKMTATHRQHWKKHHHFATRPTKGIIENVVAMETILGTILSPELWQHKGKLQGSVWEKPISFAGDINSYWKKKEVRTECSTKVAISSDIATFFVGH